jgi:hypothetical protein
MDDFFAADQLIPPLNEQDQKLHGVLFELEHTAPAAQLVAAQVEL